jgi:hypothetical protein
MKPSTPRPSNELMIVLSRLLLGQESCAALSPAITTITRNEFNALLSLANTNHVIVRCLKVFLKIAYDAHDDLRAGWAEAALRVEQARIDNAIVFLRAICDAFEEENRSVTVIKSLDHWPDLGSDLDLYTNADPDDVSRLMKERFHAQVAPRSWGDRLACKWNFILPGMPEAVEVHIGRLGQTGEQVALAAGLPRRARVVSVGGDAFRVPSASDRLMISTLQRMYRHFFFRLCDIADSAALCEAGEVDYEELRFLARAADIWEGTATYLAIVSDYLEKYRGSGLELPEFVRASARFGGNEVYFGGSFLRVPIMPQSAALYGSQLAGLLRKRELHNSARLGLLPWLATAAVVGQKITGSDKGIW